VNALADPKVGEYINRYFVSSFQRVGTFKIVGKQKQGGNVAAYFCAPDGRVLHAVAGPVNAQQMLNEAKWVVDNVYAAMKDANGDGAKFKAIWRKAHSARLKANYGINVEPVTFDLNIKQDPNSALTYVDPTGKPIAPKLPPAPINGPDVKFELLQKAEAATNGAKAFHFKGGGKLVLGNQGQVHVLMAAHSLKKIEDMYGAVFQGILGEQISTQPVQVVTPFPWVNKGGKK
jgi:hypothetical protein